MGEISDIKHTNLFATPMFAHVWSDADQMNGELRERILETEGRGRNKDTANPSGWHSEIGRLEFCGDAGRRLIRHIYEMADEAARRTLAEFNRPPQVMRWTLQAWAAVNRWGEFNPMHTYPGSTWSGAYYVDTGEPEDGETGTPNEFYDPCQGRANSFFPSLVPSSATQRPEPGLMILFPSYLPHMTYAHRGRSARISVAFNLRKEPYP